MKLLYSIMVALCPYMQTVAQPSTADTLPLSIGDLVPSVQWTQIEKGKISVKTLKDIDEPYIVLDFWSKYCYACLAAMPRLDSLQRQFSDSIRIITVSDLGSAKEVVNALGRSAATRNLALPAVYGANDFDKLFPHLMVPHMVWIGPDRKVKAITEGGYGSAEKIGEMIRGRATDWILKQDNADFHREDLFLAPASTQGVPPVLGSSAFFSYLGGVGASSGTYPDSASGMQVITIYNEDLLSFCKRALGVYDDALIGVDGKVKGQFTWNDRILFSEWVSGNTYCYQLSVPINLSRGDVEALVQADLRKWLLMMGVRITPHNKSVNGKPTTVYAVTKDAH